MDMEMQEFVWIAADHHWVVQVWHEHKGAMVRSGFDTFREAHDLAWGFVKAAEDREKVAASVRIYRRCDVLPIKGEDGCMEWMFVRHPYEIEVGRIRMA